MTTASVTRETVGERVLVSTVTKELTHLTDLLLMKQLRAASLRKRNPITVICGPTAERSGPNRWRTAGKTELLVLQTTQLHA